MTPLGRSVYASGLDVDVALALHAELRRANQSLLLATDLHLLYLVTPLIGLTAVPELPWSRFLTLVSGGLEPRLP